MVALLKIALLLHNSKRYTAPFYTSKLPDPTIRTWYLTGLCSLLTTTLRRQATRQGGQQTQTGPFEACQPTAGAVIARREEEQSTRHALWMTPTAPPSRFRGCRSFSRCRGGTQAARALSPCIALRSCARTKSHGMSNITR